MRVYGWGHSQPQLKERIMVGVVFRSQLKERIIVWAISYINGACGWP